MGKGSCFYDPLGPPPSLYNRVEKISTRSYALASIVSDISYHHTESRLLLPRLISLHLRVSSSGPLTAASLGALLRPYAFLQNFVLDSV